MSKPITFQLEARLVEPLLETLKSRAQVWQDTARLQRAQQRKDNAPPGVEAQESARMASLYAALIESITQQLDQL